MSLQTELQNDPLNRGYSQYIPDGPGVLADMLNEKIYTMHKTRFVTARTVLAEIVGGAAILDKLEIAAQTVSEVKWAMKFMINDGGIDIGYPATQSLIDNLVTANILTQQDADSLKSLALQPASRAEVLNLGFIKESDVRSALGV